MGFNKLHKDIAQALVLEAKELDSVPEIVEQVGVLAQAFASEPALLGNLSDAATDIEKRREVLKKALKGNTDTLVVNALMLLQEKEILRDFRQFHAALLESAEKLAEHREIQVISPVTLDDTERSELEKVMAHKFGGTQRFHATVDPSILGGLVIRVGDWTYDASLKGKITRLKQALYV